MPKERKGRSAASEIRCRASPYPSGSSSEKILSPEDIKEWDEVRCPICMEHPHNAVLLMCSSNDKGCRPFMCDTSYRHSNCLDQYRKAVSASKLPEESDNGEQPVALTCPLCRGLVTSWTVVESARSYMNSKSRNCSTESCGFTGVYGDLRKHARKEHPTVRPAEADPTRQQDWHRMEQQRDLADLFSMLRSAVTGDEVGISIDEDTEMEHTDASDTITSPSITVLVVVQVYRVGERSLGAGQSPQRQSSSPRSYLRGSRSRTRSLFLWSNRASSDRVSNDMPDSNVQMQEESEEVNEDEGALTRQERRRRHYRMPDDEGEDNVS